MNLIAINKVFSKVAKRPFSIWLQPTRRLVKANCFLSLFSDLTSNGKFLSSRLFSVLHLYKMSRWSPVYCGCEQADLLFARLSSGTRTKMWSLRNDHHAGRGERKFQQLNHSMKKILTQSTTFIVIRHYKLNAWSISGRGVRLPRG